MSNLGDIMTTVLVVGGIIIIALSFYKAIVDTVREKREKKEKKA